MEHTNKYSCFFGVIFLICALSPSFLYFQIILLTNTIFSEGHYDQYFWRFFLWSVRLKYLFWIFHIRDLYFVQEYQGVISSIIYPNICLHEKIPSFHSFEISCLPDYFVVLKLYDIKVPEKANFN